MLECEQIADSCKFVASDHPL